MSLHKTRICDVCHERIVGEYTRLTTHYTQFTLFKKKDRADVCSDCMEVMADALDRYHGDEGSEDVNYR